MFTGPFTRGLEGTASFPSDTGSFSSSPCLFFRLPHTFSETATWERAGGVSLLEFLPFFSAFAALVSSFAGY